MPTTYAHWRFGCDCIRTLKPELQEIIKTHRSLFDIGVHGPDIFFYDLKHQELPDYGSAMHHEPGRVFFRRCAQVYGEYSEDKEAMLAYMLGFLSHFALDSQCHCYVNTKQEVSGLSHNRVEAEYDGHLIRMDGKDTDRTDRVASLHPDRKTAEIIARFFPFGPDQMFRTLKMMKLLLTFIRGSSAFKRKRLDAYLRKKDRNDDADLIVWPDEDSACRDSNIRLDRLTGYALE